MAEPKKILITEDDTDISMVEEAYLQSAGYATKVIAGRWSPYWNRRNLT